MFDRKEVKDLAAYFRLCLNPNDEISLRRVINTPARGIGPTTMTRLTSWADEHRSSLFEAVVQADVVLGPKDRARAPLRAFRALIGETSKHVRGGCDLVGAASALIERILKAEGRA